MTRRGYVSVERLAERHPLWDDVRRLEAPAQEMERLGARTGAGPGEAGSYSLPALTLPPLPPMNAARREAVLRAEAQAQLARFSDRLQTQWERGIQRERERRERVRAAALDQARREAEADIAARATELRAANRAEVETLAGELLNLRFDIETLQSDLKIALLREDQRAFLRGRLTVIEAELATLERRVAQMDDSVMEQARREVYARVEATAPPAPPEIIDLTAVRERVHALKTSLQRDFAQVTVSRPSEESLAAGSGSASGAYAITVPVAGRGETGIKVATAVARLREQKERLRQFILLETMAAVRDAAADRNIEVVFEDAGPGIPDRTEQFAQWIAAATTAEGERDGGTEKSHR